MDEKQIENRLKIVEEKKQRHERDFERNFKYNDDLIHRIIRDELMERMVKTVAAESREEIVILNQIA